MGTPRASHPVIEEAQAALRRLAGVALVGSAAREAAEQLDERWSRTPLTLGVAGQDVAARTELIDVLCGGGVLDRRTRAPACAALRVRRGEVTRFRALRDDAAEEHVFPTDADHERAQARVEALRTAANARGTALVRAEAALPGLVRRRPPGWAFWLWPIRWLLALLTGRKRAARQEAARALDGARDELAVAEEELAQLAVHATEARDRFYNRLRKLSSGTAAGSGVREVAIEVASGPLVDGVEVLELTGWSRAAADVDLSVVVTAERAVHVEGPGEQAAARIGDLAATANALHALLAGGRASKLGRMALSTIATAQSTLEDEIERVEAGFQARLDRLEALRVADPAGFTAAQLARLGPQVVTSVAAVMQHASAHLGAAMAEVATDWNTKVASASAIEQLSAAATQIDEDAAASAPRIAGEVTLLAMGGLGGCAHDLYPELIEPLRAHGLPAESTKKPRAAPAMPPLVVLPSLAGLTAASLGTGSWLSKLFRSFDSRRDELLEKVALRATRMREVATAELLGAEPALRAALVDALTAELTDALDQQRRWLEAALADERAAIAREREALTPLTEASEAAHRDARRLAEMIAALEAAPAA